MAQDVGPSDSKMSEADTKESSDEVSASSWVNGMATGEALSACRELWYMPLFAVSMKFLSFFALGSERLNSFALKGFDGRTGLGDLIVGL
jgi:hypothetical protein